MTNRTMTRREFGGKVITVSAAAAAAGLAAPAVLGAAKPRLVVVGGVHMEYQRQIEFQESRNSFLNSEIKKLPTVSRMSLPAVTSKVKLRPS